MALRRRPWISAGEVGQRQPSVSRDSLPNGSPQDGAKTPAKRRPYHSGNRQQFKGFAFRENDLQDFASETLGVF